MADSTGQRNTGRILWDWAAELTAAAGQPAQIGTQEAATTVTSVFPELG